MSEKSKYNIKIDSTVVTQIGDNAKIYVNQHDIDIQKLKSLVLAVRKEVDSSNITDDEKTALHDNLDVIENEAVTDTPRKGFIKTALTGLQTIKGACEFGAAVATLVEFVQNLLKL